MECVAELTSDLWIAEEILALQEAMGKVLVYTRSIPYSFAVFYTSRLMRTMMLNHQVNIGLSKNDLNRLRKSST